MTDETPDPDQDNVLPFRKPEKAQDHYHENLTRFRGRVFEILNQAMRDHPFAIVDFAQALVDGATYVNLMANKAENETPVKRRVRLLIAQTQVGLEKLQVEEWDELLELPEIVN